MRHDRISNIDLYRAADPFQALFREPLWAFGSAPRRIRGLARHGTRFALQEDDGAYELTAELPGVGEEHLDLEVTRDRLRVGVLQSAQVKVLSAPDAASEGEKGEKVEGADDQGVAEERQWRLRREFTFSEALDAEGVTATIKHGVLSIKLPKLGAVSARKVPILTG